MSSGLSAQRKQLLDKLLAQNDVGRGGTRIPRRSGDRGTAPLSLGQERLYLMQQRFPDSTMFVGTGGLRLRGSVDVDLLRRSLVELVARHGALRTAIVESATGEARQRILPPAEVPVDLFVREIMPAGLRDMVAEIAAQPFDLTRPPLLRAALLRLTDESVLVLSMHHIAVDAWSLGVLLREFGEIYRALAQDRRPDLPEQTIDYGDFAAWQREQLAQGDLDRQIGHWRERLDGVPMVDLPTDRPRPERRDYTGDIVPLELGPETVTALRGLTDSLNATLFMALVAGWALVLNRWSGTPDVVVGTPVAGRTRSELENLVGFIVNTLPLRVQIDPTEDFRALVRRAQHVCADAYAHQDVPFDRIVGELPLDRDVSGQTTLARHWLALNNNTWTADWPGLAVEVLPDLVGTVRCDLSIQLAPSPNGGLTGHLEYSTELFGPDTAGRLAAAFTEVLTEGAARPDTGIVSLTRSAEPAEVPGPVPPADAGHPSIARWFESTVDENLDAIAIVADGPDLSVSYGELDRRANGVARLLLDRGVRERDVVGLCLERGVDLAAAMLGVFKAGAVAMPLPVDLPEQRRRRVIEIGQPAVVLTEAELAEAGQTAARTVIADPAADQPAYLLFTSGSTGAPKGVLGTHGGMLNRLAGMRDAFTVTSSDRVLAKASIGFDVSLWELLLPLVTGGIAVLARPGGHRDVGYLHEVIAARDVTICHFVPSLLEEFVRAEGPRPERLRLLLSGGERLSRRLAERVLERWPDIRFVNQYGPTEAVIDVTAIDVTAPVPDVVPIGRPVPGVELLVLDDWLRPVPVGVPGQLYIGGVQVALGYVGNPEETARRFVAHPDRPDDRLYATGDRVRWLPDGALDFLGRTDEQVKIRGHRIELGEIDAVLREHADVTDAQVRVRTTEAGHPQLVAYVLTASGEPPTDLAGFIADRLPAVAVPAHLVALASWPVNANGKIDISALPDPGGDAGQNAADEPPQGDVEKQLAEIWAELLGVDQVGRCASFVALGGHSLIAIRAIARIRTAFGIRVGIGEFFNTTVLADLAALIQRRVEESAGAQDDTPILRRYRT